MARTSSSALEAQEMGFLDEDDRVVMNADHLLSAAKREVLDLADGYVPPSAATTSTPPAETARAAARWAR